MITAHDPLDEQFVKELFYRRFIFPLPSNFIAIHQQLIDNSGNATFPRSHLWVGMTGKPHCVLENSIMTRVLSLRSQKLGYIFPDPSAQNWRPNAGLKVQILK